MLKASVWHQASSLNDDLLPTKQLLDHDMTCLTYCYSKISIKQKFKKSNSLDKITSLPSLTPKSCSVLVMP